jgi:hypothetical protein
MRTLEEKLSEVLLKELGETYKVEYIPSNKVVFRGSYDDCRFFIMKKMNEGANFADFELINPIGRLSSITIKPEDWKNMERREELLGS